MSINLFMPIIPGPLQGEEWRVRQGDGLPDARLSRQGEAGKILPYSHAQEFHVSLKHARTEYSSVCRFPHGSFCFGVPYRIFRSDTGKGRLNVSTLVADKDWEHTAQEGIPMVINCMQCNIDYQLEGVFLQEANKGVQICCGRCGCSLDVLILPSFLRKDEEIHQLNSEEEAS